MTLESTFYVVGIVFMIVMLILITIMVILAFYFKAKITHIQENLERKFEEMKTTATERSGDFILDAASGLIGAGISRLIDKVTRRK